MFGIAEKLRDQHAGSQFRSPDFSMAMAVNAVLGRVPEAERRSLVLEALRSRSEEHTSELQSLMRISYAVFCVKKKNIGYSTPAEQEDRREHEDALRGDE